MQLDRRCSVDASSAAIHGVSIRILNERARRDNYTAISRRQGRKKRHGQRTAPRNTYGHRSWQFPRSRVSCRARKPRSERSADSDECRVTGGPGRAKTTVLFPEKIPGSERGVNYRGTPGIIAGNAPGLGHWESVCVALAERGVAMGGRDGTS